MRFQSFACFGLLVLTITFACLWRLSENRSARMAFNYETDAAVEKRAVALKAQYEHLPIQKIRDVSVPVTVHFRDRKCVELRPRRGVAGGTEVYCFSEPSQRLIGHQSIGE